MPQDDDHVGNQLDLPPDLPMSTINDQAAAVAFYRFRHTYFVKLVSFYF